MEITLLLTREKAFQIKEQYFYDEIIKKLEENKKDLYDLNVLDDYLYLVPDMLRDEINRAIRIYPEYKNTIFSIKDKDSTILELQGQILSLHKKKIEEHNELMRKREQEHQAQDHYNDLLKKLPKSQQTAFGPLFIESVDERGLNMRHENGELYGIKEDREDGYFDFSGIKEDLPFLKDLKFYIDLKDIKRSVVPSSNVGVRITPDNGPSIFIPLDLYNYDEGYDNAIIGLTYNDVMLTCINI
jgi:hypothetical protein|nr:MAG TPA: hypothetical protein [Bacteriophage sp.]